MLPVAVFALRRIPIEGILGVDVPPDDVPAAVAAAAAEWAAAEEADEPTCLEVEAALSRTLASNSEPDSSSCESAPVPLRLRFLFFRYVRPGRLGIESSSRSHSGSVEAMLSSSPATSRLFACAALLRGFALLPAPASLMGGRESEYRAEEMMGVLSLSLSRLILALFLDARALAALPIAELFRLELDKEGAGEAKDRSRAFGFLDDEAEGVVWRVESE